MIPRSESAAMAVIRALVRQVSTAVYAWVAFALLLRLLAPGSVVTVAGLEVFIVLLASGLLARAVEGAWWQSSLVGFTVALFDLAILTAGLEGSAIEVHGLAGAFLQIAYDFALIFGLLTLAGMGGAWLGRLRRAPRSIQPGKDSKTG